jgi:transposase
MQYVGIDLHKKSITVCAMNKDRQVVACEDFSTKSEKAIVEWFRSLGEFQAVIEATSSYEWLFKLLEPMADRMILADPSRLRVIAESTQKSDRVDAQILAKFVALDMIPQATRPSPRRRALKRLVNQRLFITRQQARLRCRIRAILAEYNADVPELFRAVGKAYLKKVSLEQEDRFVINQMMREWEYLQKQLEAINARLKAFAKKAPNPEKEARAVLKTIPGVGTVTVDVVIAEVGDVTRFRNSKQVVAYAGLAPGYRESAGKRKSLGITKKGSPRLRWALVEAAWRLIRQSPKWGRRFDGLAGRIGRKRAIVALARRLLHLMVSMLRTSQPYHLAA